MRLRNLLAHPEETNEGGTTVDDHGAWRDVSCRLWWCAGTFEPEAQ